jgi:hypothetical protein
MLVGVDLQLGLVDRGRRVGGLTVCWPRSIGAHPVGVGGLDQVDEVATAAALVRRGRRGGIVRIRGGRLGRPVKFDRLTEVDRVIPRAGTIGT